jgi:hypothetical protein
MRTAQACPSPQTLSRLLTGELDAADREAVELHVADCLRCGVALSALRAGASTVVPSAHPTTDPDSCVCPPPQPAWRPAPVEAGLPLGPPQAEGELGRLGGYRVLKMLGAGGMGLVFHAEDPLLGRPVALKVMSPTAAADPINRERFLREAKATAAVEHDHIVAIYHVGEDRGVPFLAMPLLRGESLEERLAKGGKLAVAEALRIGREITEGLSAAHRHGLIHRDVKPANVWLEAGSGRVKLLDFGLARTGRETARLTQSGYIVGTPSYMAPEQARAEDVDARADLFSLGCILYRAVTGRPPFPGEDVLSVLSALATATPPPPCVVDPAVPPELSALITALLTKDPARRPESARVVADKLAALAKAEATRDRIKRQSAVATAALPSPPAGKSRPRRWLLWMAGAALLIVTTAAVARRFPTAVDGGEPSRQADGGAGTAALSGDLTALEGRASAPDADRKQVADETRAWWREHAAAPDKMQAARLLRRLPSPLDRLSPGQVAGERLNLKGLVALVRGHDGPVGPVAFSPDGRTLATGGGEQDQTVAVWDLGGEAPRLRARLGPLGHAVSMLAFSPDGKTLAASGWDGTVRLWDARPDVPRDEGLLRQPLACFTCLAFAADGRGLAAGTDRGVVWVWDLGQAPPAARALRPEGFGVVTGVAFAPQGKMLVAAGAGVRLWELGGPQPVEKALPGEAQAEVRGVGFSPDGRLLAAGYTTGLIRTWDMAGGATAGPVVRRHTDQVWSVAFSPDGRLLASGGWDGRVAVWGAGDGARRVEWAVPGEHVNRVAFAPDSRHLAFSAGNKVYVVRLAPPGEPER